MMKNKVINLEKHFLALLPTGKVNALTAREIKGYLPFNVDLRIVQALVERLRLKGVLICSNLDGKGGGYYRPANDDELLEYVRHELKRIEARKASLQPAIDYLGAKAADEK
jgi:hypothetical protein